MSTIDLQALVALDDEIDRGLIEAVVSGRPNVNVLDYLEVGGPTASGYGAGDVLLVACSEYRAEVGEYVAQAARQHPARPIVLACPPQANGYLPEAFGTGVEDVVTLPVESGRVDGELIGQLGFALEKAVLRRRGTPTEDQRGLGRMVCVLGLKGGCGKTLTVANTGVALAATGSRVALVDLDLQFGDLGLALGLRPERTVYDLVRSGGSLDAEKLDDYLVRHESGANALLAPVIPDQAGHVTVPFLKEVMRLLRETHDLVLIDTPPNFTPEVIAAIDASTDVLMVAMRDTLALKNTKLGLETLERMGYDRSRIRLVLNRANTNVGIGRDDVLAIIGRDADVQVPSHRDVTRSINTGQPIVAHGSSPAAKAFRRVAELYGPAVKGSARRRAPVTELRSAAPQPPADRAAAGAPAVEGRSRRSLLSRLRRAA